MAKKKKVTRKKKHIKVNFNDVTPEIWNRVFVLITAILFLGLVSGFASYVEETQSHAPTFAAAEPIVTITSSSQVRNKVLLLANRLGATGNIYDMHFDKGQWFVDYEFNAVNGKGILHVIINDDDGSYESISITVNEPNTQKPVLNELSKGSGDVQVVLFCDFTNSYCKNAFSKLVEMEKNLPIKIGYRNLVFSSDGQKAAEASYCAYEQGKFWEFAEKVYSGTKDYEAVASEVGMDVNAFKTCVLEGRPNPVQNDFDEAKKLNVPGVPAFFVNEWIYPGLDLNTVEKVVLAKL